MKRLILLALIAVPVFAFTADFIYNDYDNYDRGEYWEDEYWDDYYWSDGHWVYYPHGYYCVHYVWWYPWWWDWYWHRCHWAHNFHWDFFYAGYYVVWYENGGWWYRPRYGRWVRYQLPYSYHELRYKARERGYNLPDKPPREINIPYKESEVIRLSKEKDPEAFKRIEQEHKSGNLEKMRTDYVDKVKKEINVKNAEHRIDAIKNDNYKKEQDRNTMPTQFDNRTVDKNSSDKYLDNEKDNKSDDNGQPRIIKREKDHIDDSKGDVRPGPKDDRNESNNQNMEREKQDKDNESIKPPTKEKKPTPVPQNREERDRAPNNIPSKKDREKSR
ncbi:hypothetical protein A2Y85_04295 [candidate division WOR-3 bacterium RBG_13_43_14]|uniref:DUF5667 domain-containing protein n=1 Tax=candidate division WOR-3 bacterium RBG_13_43_14 TaxID=1802590 RepID=A0A1F4UF00_UNCW3|nr:MAG: hypothetical protein A2Y85_04295 [candidate division WOR-3 bacterium RBG_13_43_14]